MAYRVLSLLLPVDIVYNILEYAKYTSIRYNRHDVTLLHIRKLLNGLKIKNIVMKRNKDKTRSFISYNKDHTGKITKDYNYTQMYVNHQYKMSIYVNNIIKMVLNPSRIRPIISKDILNTICIIRYNISKRVNKCQECNWACNNCDERFCSECDYSKCPDNKTFYIH